MGGWVSNDPCHPNSPDGFSSVPFTGICNKLHPCLNLLLPQQDVLAPPCETTSLEASLGVAARPTKPPGNKLLNHLGTLPSDESILETLSPQLTIGADSSGVNPERMLFSMTERLKGLLSCA